MFTYIELFAGIGGFRQALDKLGGECVFASEIDKYAAQAYEVLYGERPAGDITKIEAEDIPRHDLLVGGFPCQAFSVAGRRAGFEDIRGTLFFDIARIALQKQPKAILLENVKGLINHDKGNTFRVMIEMLCNIGYTVDFDILNSKYFGVPQNRERVFIVGVRSDLILHEPWNIVGNTVVPRSKQRLQELEGIKSFNFNWPQQSEVTTRLRDILKSDVDERYYLSEDKTAKLVAQLEAKEDRSLLQGKNGTFGRINEYSGDGAGPTLTATCYKEPDMILENEPQMVGSLEHYIAPSGIGKGRRTHVAVNDPQHFPTPDGINNTLRTGGKGSLTAKHNYEHIAEPQDTDKPRYRIRKLTPLECWRLQGFPDEAHEAVKAAGVSDSQRYKQAGNAVTVNVIEAIAARLIPLLGK